jgi:hypothetical protein
MTNIVDRPHHILRSSGIVLAGSWSLCQAAGQRVKSRCRMGVPARIAACLFQVFNIRHPMPLACREKRAFGSSE